MPHKSRPKFDPQKHHRRSIRLKGYDYSQEGAYYVTIVTYHRDCLFGEIVNEEMILNDLGKIANECWCAIPEHFPFVELGAYVIMPNHAHGIIVIRNDESRINVGATHWVAPTNPERHTMPNNLIYCQLKNKNQATHHTLTNTSPSPFRGSWRGVPMPHDQPYLLAEKKIEEA